MPFMDNVGKAAGLLSTGSPMLDIGLGLLAQSGPTYGPAPSLGQAFAGASQFAQQREQGRLRTSAMREQLNQATRRNQAMQELQGLLGATTEVKTPATNNMLSPTGGSVGSNISQVPTMQTPEGQQRYMGLLGEIAPEAMVQGLLAQQFSSQSPRTSTELNDFQAISGMSPSDPGFMEAFAQYRQSNVDPMQTLQMQNLMLEIQDRLNSRDEAESEQIEEARLAANSFDSVVSTIAGMAEANANLAGTFLETGALGAGSGTRRSISSLIDEASRVFGNGERAGLDLETNLDNFNTLSNNLVDLMVEGLNTDASRQIRQATKPNANLTPEANASAMLRILDETRRAHAAQGTEFNPETLQAIEQLRPVLEAQARGEWSGQDQMRTDAQAVRGWTADQVRSSLNNFRGFPQDVQQALIERAEELGL